MNQLSVNWLTEGLIDAEYKKYVLLAYLQEVTRKFDERKLYPFLSDLVYHYRSLLTLQKNKEAASGQFPKKIEKIDLENFTVEYEKVMNDDYFLDEIETILNFAIPKLQEHLNNGTEIYEFVETKIDIVPIGIIPLRSDEGYLLISNGNSTETQAFTYRITIFDSALEKYRAIKTNFFDHYTRSLSNSYESIKLDLIKRNKDLPNPATFAVQSSYTFPLHETLLPVAKRNLVRLLSTKYKA